MARLEDLTPGTLVKGIIPDAITELISSKWHGSDVLEVVYKDTAGRVGTEILFRDRESALQVLTAGRPWSFDGDGRVFRLVSEAHRIRLAHLFDPLVAVHSSLVEPLPHQITAVYESMLPRQPLRFLLADDPGALWQIAKYAVKEHREHNRLEEVQMWSELAAAATDGGDVAMNAVAAA